MTTRDRAAELSHEKGIEIQLAGFGQARVEKGYMPMATIPAARAALEMADLDIKDVGAVKTHNPFTVNDIVFAEETASRSTK